MPGQVQRSRGFPRQPHPPRSGPFRRRLVHRRGLVPSAAVRISHRPNRSSRPGRRAAAVVGRLRIAPPGSCRAFRSRPSYRKQQANTSARAGCGAATANFIAADSPPGPSRSSSVQGVDQRRTERDGRPDRPVGVAMAYHFFRASSVSPRSSAIRPPTTSRGRPAGPSGRGRPPAATPAGREWRPRPDSSVSPRLYPAGDRRPRACGSAQRDRPIPADGFDQAVVAERQVRGRQPQSGPTLGCNAGCARAACDPLLSRRRA